jgi:hypothetical protein
MKITDIESAAVLGALLSKDYARGMLELLSTYRDISASEAASRLGLHIRTAQDFLDALASIGILSKEEVYEKKRPYYRYALSEHTISLELDLDALGAGRPAPDRPGRTIRERKGSGAVFTTARSGDSISSVTIWSGTGRDRRERRFNLTAPQGSFLYHLPFPDAAPLGVAEIMRRAGVDISLEPEILDIVGLLEEAGVIEIFPRDGQEVTS